MNDRPKGFIVQSELIKELCEIGFSAEDIGTLILAMNAYVAGQELPEMDKAVKAVFVTRIRGLLDKDIEKYQKTCERNRENGQYGKLGGRPKKETQNGLSSEEEKPIETQSGFSGDAKSQNPEEKTLKHKTQNTNNNSNELLVLSAKSKARPSSPDQVRDYRQSLGYPHFDAERFFNYYERNGWVQGRNKPIKDWKARVRNWQKNEKVYSKDKPKTESWVDFAMRMGGDN